MFPPPLRRAAAIAGPVVAVLLVAACGSPTGVATNPPVPETAGEGGPSAGGSGSPAPQTSGVRTVLSPLGVNIRNSDSRSAPVLETAGQGKILTVLGHSDREGGWYRVRGETVTGWVSADPDLTAPGRFNQYRSAARAFAALYPDRWTFAEEPADVLFHPQSGPERIVARTAPTVDALGPAGQNGYSPDSQLDVVVCGVTGSFVDYERAGGSQEASASPSPAASGQSPGATGAPSAPPPALERFAQVRLRLDPAHALELDYSYSRKDELQTFRDVVNSVTFPFPQCQQGAAPAQPGAAAPAPIP